jgi:hypothetical protein
LGLLATLCALCVVLVLALGAAPAFAAKEYLVPGTPFGEAGSGSGQFKEPTGVAANASTELSEAASGDVYVADTGNNRVEQFTATRAFVRAWGWGVTDGKAEFEQCAVSCQEGIAGSGEGQLDTPEAIAVDNAALSPSKGDVYVGNSIEGVIEKYSAAGVFLGEITEAAGEAFRELHGVAVDPSGNLWVYHGEAFAKNVAEFSATGVLTKTFEIDHGLGPGIAVDSKGHFYVDRANGTVLRYDASTGAELGEFAELTGARALAINPSTSNVLVDEGESNSVALYPPFAEPATPVESFPGATEPLAESEGVAVGAGGTAYVGQRAANNVLIFTHALNPAVTTGSADLIAEGSERLHGAVNPEGEEITECTFEYGAQAGVYPNTIPCAQSPAEINAASTGAKTTVPVSADVTGLTPDSRYHFRLAAISSGGENQGEDRTFTAAARPAITEEATSTIGSTSATVTAQINPGGLPTTYHVEYGPTTSYGSSSSDQSIGAGLTAAGVEVQVNSLQPAALYHYRFTATNSLNTTPGNDRTLTTTASGGPSALMLPDGRAYEQVSPPDNRDVDLPQTVIASLHGNFTPSSPWPFQAAAGGDAVAYQGLPPSSGGNGFEVGSKGNQFLATRTSKGWEASDITPAPVGPEEESVLEFFESFSSDLSVGIIHSQVQGLEETQRLTADASPCDILYSRASNDGRFAALFSATLTPKPSLCGQDQVFAGASADSSHSLFQSPVALTGQAEASAGKGQANLYDAVGGQLHSVNVQSDGKPAPNATFGGPPPLGGQSEEPNFSSVISHDGSRVFWTALEPSPLELPSFAFKAVPRALYVRENGITTQQIDATHGPGPSGGGRFWAASSDGSKVFFTDCSTLTTDSTALPAGPCEHSVVGTIVSTGHDLYEYDVNVRTLTDLTVDPLTVKHTGDPTGADVQGVLGASPDGSYVYFVASGALAPGATPRICQHTAIQAQEVQDEFHKGLISEQEEEERIKTLEIERGEAEEGKIPPKTGCNLYLARRGQPLTFVQTLAPEDNQLQGGGFTGDEFGVWKPDLGHRLARVSANGDLVFESRNSLTGYDNFVPESALTGGRHGALEVFVYHAATDRLACVSCQPSGAPHPIVQGGVFEEPLRATGENSHMARWIAEDGSRVFFNTAQPLVPQDTNGQQDVYEWEREGVGSCPIGTPPTASGGCVFLLSGGSSPYLSVFIDTDEKGENVFFETRGQLVPQDHNSNLKLYDARVGGGFPESALACEGTGCQGVPQAAPSFATPASATFTGVGNFPLQAPSGAKSKTHAQVRAEKLAKALRACRTKHNRHRRAVCKARARKRYSAARRANRSGSARKATNKREATR